MKVLSLWNPWAYLMALGKKQVETRHWTTSYRGLVAIHATRSWTSYEYHYSCQFGLSARMVKATCGSILCVAELVDCVSTVHARHYLSEEELRYGNYEAGRWAWLFRNIRPLKESYPYKGRQGLFDAGFSFDAAVLKAVEPNTVPSALLPIVLLKALGGK